MGTGMSFPKEITNLAKSNRNAPSLFRLYNVPDHLYPYELKKIEKSIFPDFELAIALETFNNLIALKLGAQKQRNTLTDQEIEIFKAVVSPAKLLYSNLLCGKDTKDIKLELMSDEKQVYMCRSYLIELSPNICKLTNITILQVCCNYLRYLPFGITQLRKLKMLILSRNRLTCLPEDIGYLKELREIDVSHNLIEKLPKLISTLKKLNTLQVGNNLLTEIPSFIGKCHSLKYLNISNNKIERLPFELFKLPFLLSLNSAGCNFSSEASKQILTSDNMSLQETAARNLIRKNICVRSNIDPLLAKYIIDAEECCFCGGPLFNSFYYIEDFHLFESAIYPIHYKMCCQHYDKHEDRLSTMFERSIQTFPSKLIEESLPSVTELFEPSSYEVEAEPLESGNKQVKLIELRQFRKPKNAYDEIDSFFEIENENLNVFDEIFRNFE